MTELSAKSFIGLVALLAECKKRGYKELWLNCANPHWISNSCIGMIIAAPKRRHGSWPAVWDLQYVPHVGELLGEQGCGNGLKNADQAQYNDLYKNIPPSHYVLVDGDWLLEGETV
jgi:hypothetical protein